MLLAVADGLGGHPAGDIASRVAIETLHDAVRNSFRVFDNHIPHDPGLLLKNGFSSAANVVFRRQIDDPALSGMGTTLTAALIDDTGNGVIAHAGDSRAYIVDGSMRQITRDHSVVQEMADRGEIPQSQVSRHPMHNRLTRALGSPGVNPDMYQFRTGSGMLLLCSDGLTEGLTDAGIFEIIAGNSFSGTCQALVHAAKRKSRDNITVTMAKVKQ